MRGPSEDERGARSERPSCPKCGGPTESKGRDGNRYCHRCRAPRAVHFDRPCCAACRRQMEPGPNGYWRCRPCCVYVHASKPPRAARLLGRPRCPAHARPMQADRGGRYRCAVCARERAIERAAERERREAEAAALLSAVTARLPRYLSTDERDDAAQSIILDVLAGRLAPAVPPSVTLRRYAARARGMTSDRFCFVSLSEPTRDGRVLGETLVG